MKIRTRLVLAFAGSSLIPIALVGYLGYRTAIRGMEQVRARAEQGFTERAEAQLVALRDAKKAQIERYTQDRRGDLNSLAENIKNIRHTALQTLGASHESKKRALESLFQQYLADLKAQQGRSICTKGLSHYEAFLETGQASKEYERYTSIIDNFVQNERYGDYYIIDPAGRCVYSATQGEDFNTNLLTGPYAKTHFGEAVERALQGETVLTDFLPYPAKGDRRVAFGVAPILSGEKQTSVVAFEIALGPINQIVRQRDGLGLGKTGETYLVGRDSGTTSYRTDRVTKEGKPGQSKSGKFVDRALDGQSGRAQKIGSTGAVELICYSPLDIPGTEWVIITTIAFEEVLNADAEGQEGFCKQFIDAYGYYDLFVMNATGYCFHSVCHEPDYGTNLLTGPYKDSNLGTMVKTITETKGFAFADFAPYAPSNGDPAAFIGSPIVSDGETELIVALQLSDAGINEMLSNRAGLGKTGSTYLVGIDPENGKTTLRSDQTVMDPKYVLGYEVTTPYIAEAFATRNAENQGTWTDVDGNEVIAAYTHIAFFGADWGLFAKVNSSEALAAVTEIQQIGKSAADSMRSWTLYVGLGIGAVALGCGFWIAVRIVKPLQQTTAMLKDISEGEGDLTCKLDESANDELGEMAHWFNAFVDKLRSLVRHVADNSKSLGAASSQLSSTATQLSQGADETTQQATSVASATEEMSSNMVSMAAATEQMTANISTVAAATDELTASVDEIAKSAEHASTVADGAADLARSSNATIGKLGDAADEIGKVIDVIQDIADQTNLLALNATIEAARAGAAGNGFAVVATEVKELARKTAEATEDIRHRIEDIQVSSTNAVEAIGQISQVIDDVKGVSRSIASAVEEQSITTKEISRNVAETTQAAQTVSFGVTQSATASGDINRTIAGVDDSAKQTAQGAALTKNAGEELFRLANELDALVNCFKT